MKLRLNYLEDILQISSSGVASIITLPVKRIVLTLHFFFLPFSETPVKACGLLCSILQAPCQWAKLLLNILWSIMGIIALAHMQKYLLGSFNYIKIIALS